MVYNCLSRPGMTEPGNTAFNCTKP